MEAVTQASKNVHCGFDSCDMHYTKPKTKGIGGPKKDCLSQMCFLKTERDSIAFFLNVLTELSQFSDKKIVIKRVHTCHFFCKRPGCYHSVSLNSLNSKKVLFHLHVGETPIRKENDKETSKICF